MRRWWTGRTDEDRFNQAVFDYVQRDVKHNGLAAAVLRCRLISLGHSPEEINKVLGQAREGRIAHG